MKRISSRIEKTGDRVKVYGLFRNRWRKPAGISVTAEDTDSPTESLILEGDIKDVTDTLNALAEVAWENGWRPMGLSVVIDHVIKNFKLPKPE